MKKVGEANRGVGRNVCLTYRQTIYAQFMKKTIIAAALFTACCLHAQAQTWSYGLHAGINSSGYTGGKAYTIYGNSDRIGYEVATSATRCTADCCLLLAFPSCRPADSLPS